MKAQKKLFYLGAIGAFALGGAILDIQSLEAVSRNFSLASLPDDLRMALDLGIIDAYDIQNRSIDVPIKRREFAVLLKNTLQLLGDPAGSTLNDLFVSGILEFSKGKTSISRRQALEALARMAIHLGDNGFLSIDPEARAIFSDYNPPQKYMAAVALLKGNHIVKGYGDGYFGSGRALTKREAASLAYRLYEFASSSLMNRNKGKEISFVDLPEDHLAMVSIRSIERMGAFDQLKMRPSFDGDKLITTGNAARLVSGILTKCKKFEALNNISTEMSRMPPKSAATREFFAILLNTVLEAGTPRNADMTEMTPYIDVGAGSRLATALEVLGKRGIVLGYPGGNLRGGENITWFEAVGTLDAACHTVRLRDDEPAVNDQKDKSPLTRDDLGEFVALIKAKQARVRGILKMHPLTPEMEEKFRKATQSGGGKQPSPISETPLTQTRTSTPLENNLTPPPFQTEPAGISEPPASEDPSLSETIPPSPRANEPLMAMPDPSVPMPTEPEKAALPEPTSSEPEIQRPISLNSEDRSEPASKGDLENFVNKLRMKNILVQRIIGKKKEAAKEDLTELKPEINSGN